MALEQQAIPGAREGVRATWSREALLAAAVLSGICLFLFWNFLSRQARWAIDMQADWGHTLVIPLIAGYFVYLRREQLLAKPFRTTWVGLVPVVLGVFIYMVSNVGPLVLHHHNVMGFGVWLTLTGLVLLFTGFRAFAWLIFPLAYVFVFGQTISDRLMTIVTYPMQDITARGSAVALELIGWDIRREGNTIFVLDGSREIPLNIAEACSGMRMLMAFLALGVAMAFTGLKYTWQRIMLVVLAVPTAIFVNILRVMTLAMLSVVDVEFAAGDFHTFIGLVWLVPAFFIYLGLLWILRHLVVEDAKPTPKAS